MRLGEIRNKLILVEIKNQRSEENLRNILICVSNVFIPILNSNNTADKGGQQLR